MHRRPVEMQRMLVFFIPLLVVSCELRMIGHKGTCEPECVVEEDVVEANMDERHDSDDGCEMQRMAVKVGSPVMMPDGPCDLPNGSSANGKVSEE